MRFGVYVLLILSQSLALAGEKLFLRGLEQGQSASAFSPLSAESLAKTQYFIVQFKETITEKERALLQSHQFKIIRYIPDDAYVVKGEGPNIGLLQEHQAIQKVAIYRPEFKFDLKEFAISVFNAREVNRLAVRVFDGEDLSLVIARVEKLESVKIIVRGENSFIVEMPYGGIQALSLIDGIEWIEIYHEKRMQKLPTSDLWIKRRADNLVNTNIPNTPLENLTGYESGTKIMNFGPAWARGFNGQGQIIGVADTGLDTGNLETLSPDFKNIQRFYIAGWSSRSWGDPDGHGTHVAGSVLGLGLKSNRQILGGAYGARLVMQSMWSQEAQNLTVPPDFSVLFKYAYRDGARIHTNSWADAQVIGLYDQGAEIADKFMWEHPDMLILFAAGNDGIDGDRDGRIDPGSIASPATAKNIITVGASENLVDVGGIQDELGLVGDQESGFRWPVPPLARDKLSNNINGLAAFSGRGPTRDGRLKPDVVAPGTNILSACSQHKGASGMWGYYNQDYCYSGGTSMSTPLVAGAAAVVRQYLIRQFNLDVPSAALIKGVLMHTTDDMYPGQFGAVGAARGQELLTPGPNSDQGYGRVNVGRAINGQVKVADVDTGVGPQEDWALDVPSGVTKVTLVYTDYPGSPAASKALVNDLDLEVYVGDTFYASKSRVNNVEQVTLKRGLGAARILVKGYKVPMGKNGKQPFALVYH